MTRARIGSIAVWVVSVLLTAAFILAGLPKLVRAPVWIDTFDGWGYSSWFLVTIGGIEVLGALLLLIPSVAVIGAGVLGIVMLGAGYTHLANGEGLEVLRPLLFLGFLVVVGWARRRRYVLRARPTAPVRAP